MTRRRIPCTGAGGSHCSCDAHRSARRSASRRHHQEERDRADAERNRTATTCQHRHGSGTCGKVLEVHTDGNGRTSLVCPNCERRKRGICRDCPRPVEGRIGSAVRCARCKKIATNRSIRASEARHRDERRARDRQRIREGRKKQDPRYLAKLEYKRAYRRANREKVAAQKRRSYERNREKVAAYMAEYRAKHREHYRDLQNRKAKNRAPDWSLPMCQHDGCGAPIQWDWMPRNRMTHPPAKCDAHLWAFEFRRREELRAQLYDEARAEMASGAPQRRRIRRPPAMAPRSHGMRKCLTPGCTTVLTGRRKKCKRCKEREAQQAAALLSSRSGRGRRIDLERSA